MRFADGGPEILFRDVRKFGKIAYLRPGQEDPRLTKLGRDTLDASVLIPVLDEEDRITDIVHAFF